VEVRPVVLEGRLVRLEPLSLDHLPGLERVALAPAIWAWMPVAIETAEALRAHVDAALELAASGAQRPFVTVLRESGQVVGATRYMAIEPAHRRLEVGWTWVAPAWHGRGVNDEAKLLQLGHAFEALGCRRVEFKTDSRNERSRAALLGIGATFEGVFRNHMIARDGRARHSAWYSVIAEEWPAVRARLEQRLHARL
jgi:N-acetyltransferase